MNYEIKETETILENNKVVVYGIVCKSANMRIDDVSLNRKLVEKIVEKLNSYDVNEIHFFDVVIDELISNY